MIVLKRHDENVFSPFALQDFQNRHLSQDNKPESVKKEECVKKEDTIKKEPDNPTATQKQFTAYLKQQIEEKFFTHEHESYGWYQKNHPDTIKEIEEHLFLKNIRTKEDFPIWLENAKRSLITANRK